MIQSMERAIYMLRIAAQYIKDNYPEGAIVYDSAECDGYCLTDDCLSAAEVLELEKDVEESRK